MLSLRPCWSRPFCPRLFLTGWPKLAAQALIQVAIRSCGMPPKRCRQSKAMSKAKAKAEAKAKAKARARIDRANMRWQHRRQALAELNVLAGECGLLRGTGGHQACRACRGRAAGASDGGALRRRPVAAPAGSRQGVGGQRRQVFLTCGGRRRHHTVTCGLPPINRKYNVHGLCREVLDQLRALVRETGGDRLPK